MRKLFLTSIIILASVAGFSQEKKEEPEFKLKQYFMVLLKRGPNTSLDSLQLQEIQRKHLENINRLAEEKKLVIAGPFGDNTDLRGIFILDVPTMEEAIRLTESDPAVQVGRLIMEIHPWYSEPGVCLP